MWQRWGRGHLERLSGYLNTELKGLPGEILTLKHQTGQWDSLVDGAALKCLAVGHKILASGSPLLLLEGITG